MPLSNSARATAAAITVASLIALNSTAFAADAPAAASAPTKEMRERMATLHEQMASCLRSDKQIAECRTEMRKHCQAVMGSQGCTRMMGMGGMMGMGRGMHGRMTSSPPQ